MMQNKLTAIDYRKRLEAASEELAEGALLLIAPKPSIRNSNQENVYRQDSFFYYLTGFEEPQAALLILSHRKKGDQYHLFLRDNNALEELWEGKRLGVAGAQKSLAIDKSYPIETLWSSLPEMIDGARRLYYAFGRNELHDRHLIQALIAHKKRKGRTTTSMMSVHDSDFIAGRMRLFKSPEEVERLKVAASITQGTFERIYREVKPGMNERDIWAIINYEFLARGAEMEAYTSIVAGGANACCLHYRSNNAPLKDGELLLIDAGSQFQYYSSDVTRTFPIGKSFNKQQKEIYSLVLKSQEACIETAKPGATLVDIFNKAADILSEGLIDLGLLKASKTEVIEKKLYAKYFPHNTSHWIGMDVHDVGDYHEDGKPRPLQEGMFFSVEPGLYFDPTDMTVPEPYRGIGVRIEDDVLITKNSNEVLTKGIKKQIADLENRS